ncbi:unnamed protein product, partial [marine sediment metagenome]
SEIVEIVACTLEPHHLTYYAQDLATIFHSLYFEAEALPSP